MRFFEFGEPVLFEGQDMWATAPARDGDGSVDREGVHVSVLCLVLGRARVVRHRGYTPMDWEPMEGW